MRVKKTICIVLTYVLLSGMVLIPVSAEQTPSERFSDDMIATYAIGSFSMSIPGKSQAQADTSFSLAAGETVTIKASYYPFSASVDVGLIAPDGYYYSVNVTGGSIDKTIQVSENGRYTLQIRNNSNSEISVSGYVNY